MDPRTALSLPARCRSGTTLVEVVVCLAVLGLFVTGFVRHLGGTAASSARLAERTKAEEVARAVRALLSAEDPWSAPAGRNLSLSSDGTPAAAGAASYDVRIEGSARCAGGAMPADNPAAPPPGGCPDAVRALRHWHIAVSFPARYADAGRDSVTSDVDVDASSPTATSTGSLLP
jgi:hypothetical protein